LPAYVLETDIAKSAKPTQIQAEAVAEYKEILHGVMDSRPSGTRLRLATALGKNRSFVSQITNPQYATPIPARHLDTIFDICHFPQSICDSFMEAYSRAHPMRLAKKANRMRLRRHTVLLPDKGDADTNEKIDALIADFVCKLAMIMNDQEEG